ncbi:MAG TPA: metallopeptidase family protein [Alphaproteobacteria bacterium]|jgi:predicted Zn-dependent protease with MMP-like domain|nr:metallopeptidase family protein [Alphaproteobacteria bacterium]MDP7164136.1 metallopeptidase family protein [Alphaproteobacteria bacterium]MDP7428606.1 metallopeptidase family protein [Alphaproteobacteria bacterium]HJM50248.1 metallopeptidase family protein [Alphaproteobacteria bacterium]|tara:strand:+ start:613 stop:1023 length:411 start_codon:yes stop_codon:yes gene_type:complete
MEETARYAELAPSAAEFEVIADAAYRAIPARLRGFVDDVVIRVAEFPDRETLDELGIQSEYDLLGLYRGLDLARKSVLDTPVDVDMILLYRQPILAYWCESEDSLGDLVRNVLIHEIGHHFGFSDADMAKLEAPQD